MTSEGYGIDTSPQEGNPIPRQRIDLPGSWADWSQQLVTHPDIGKSGQIFKLAEKLAEASTISTESATSLLLWLGSVCMLRHTQIHWPNGIWQPGGLIISTVEEDGIPIESITNEVIRIAERLKINPINDTVKEGPAGLIARLEAENRQHQGPARVQQLRLNTVEDLSKLDTESMEVYYRENVGNVRALIYPSGRAMLSYLYDTPFFNALDELLQHGNLSIRGKHDTHQLSRVHMSLFFGFYQGALVNLTSDSRVQNNMMALMRQLLVLWPTSGIRRHRRQKNVAVVSHQIQQVASNGITSLRGISNERLEIPELSEIVDAGYLEAGVGIRYTVLNRAHRLAKIAIAVAFWRIADGGNFTIETSDLAIADSILHSHEMGGRLLELSVSKGRLGHEFMRTFIELLNGETAQPGSELAFATELGLGANAVELLTEMSVVSPEGKLSDEYRFVKGTTMAAHKKRWGLA